MAIDVDVEETLRKLTATQVSEGIEAGKSLNEMAGAMPGYQPYDSYYRNLGLEQDHEFKGTLKYQPRSNDWRWVLYRRHFYGWRNRKVGWEHMEYGTADTERKADIELRTAAKRHRQESERTVLL